MPYFLLYYVVCKAGGTGNSPGARSNELACHDIIQSSHLIVDLFVSVNPFNGKRYFPFPSRQQGSTQWQEQDCTTMKSLSVLLSVLVTLLGCNGLLAFQAGGGPARSWVSRSERISGISVVSGLRMTATARTSPEEKKPGHFLLEEFRTHSGEVLDPYDILKVSRDAERSEVRKAYLALSKRYHPDSVRNKSILPGKL